MLEAAGKRSHNPKLVLLAGQVKPDAFKKVQESMEKMVNDRVTEKEDEIKFKDYCIDLNGDGELFFAPELFCSSLLRLRAEDARQGWVAEGGAQLLWVWGLGARWR